MKTNLERGNQLSGIIPNSPQMWPKLRASLNKEILTWECNEALIICYLWGPFPSVLHHHDLVRGLQFKDNWVLCKQIPEGTRKIELSIHRNDPAKYLVRFLLIKVYYEWEYYGQSHLHTQPSVCDVMFGKVMFLFQCSVFRVCVPAWGMLTTRMQETVLK